MQGEQGNVFLSPHCILCAFSLMPYIMRIGGVMYPQHLTSDKDAFHEHASHRRYCDTSDGQTPLETEVKY